MVKKKNHSHFGIWLAILILFALVMFAISSIYDFAPKNSAKSSQDTDNYGIISGIRSGNNQANITLTFDKNISVLDETYSFIESPFNESVQSWFVAFYTLKLKHNGTLCFQLDENARFDIDFIHSDCLETYPITTSEFYTGCEYQFNAQEKYQVFKCTIEIYYNSLPKPEAEVNIHLI